MSSMDKIGHQVIKIGKIQTDIYAFLANFSTLVNLSLGLLISLLIIFGNPIEPILTTRMIVLGASFDAIDGRLARRSKMKSKLGAQFDTAADQITFGAAPTLMILNKLFEFGSFYAILLAFIYFFAASFRLSRFMIEPSSGYFSGMPSPVSAIFIGAWYMRDQYSVPLFAASVAMISFVMISKLPYSGFKTTRSFYQNFWVVFTVAMMLLLTYSPSTWMSVLSTIWIIYIYYFVIFGPKHARHNMEIDRLQNESEKENMS